MKRINDLALQASKLRNEAYYLEKDAIKAMNEEVVFKTDAKPPKEATNSKEATKKTLPPSSAASVKNEKQTGKR